MGYELKVDGMAEISETLTKLEERAPAVAAKALYEGAGIMADEVKKGADSIRTAPFKWASNSAGDTRLPSPEEKDKKEHSCIILMKEHRCSFGWCSLDEVWSRSLMNFYFFTIILPPPKWQVNAS